MRVGRPAGKRPVIAMRVHPDLYADIRKEARRRKLTISGEAARRLGATVENIALEKMVERAVCDGIKSAERFYANKDRAK